MLLSYGLIILLVAFVVYKLYQKRYNPNKTSTTNKEGKTLENYDELVDGEKKSEDLEL